MPGPGRCRCRCECINTAVIRVRPTHWWNRFLPRWWKWGGVNVCWDCGLCSIQQVERTGKIWRRG